MSWNAFATPLRTIRAHARRFGRSVIVGGGGSALDFGALMLSIRLLGLDPTWSRVVGLVAGGVVLFYGSRSFAFQATAEGAAPQARRFVMAELIGFPLNVVVFKLLLSWLPSVAPELVSLVANFVLFVSYYYPVRSQLVFKTRAKLVVPPVAAVPAPITAESPAPPTDPVAIAS